MQTKVIHSNLKSMLQLLLLYMLTRWFLQPWIWNRVIGVDWGKKKKSLLAERTNGTEQNVQEKQEQNSHKSNVQSHK